MTLNLDETPGSVTAAQIKALHSAMRPKIRRGADLHEAVGFLAWERFKVHSLKELSKHQAGQLLQQLGWRPLKDKPPRPRRKVARPGVIKKSEPWHAQHIRKLATVLGWGDLDLRDWLRRWHKVDTPEQLLTAKQAGEAIRDLKLKLTAGRPLWAAAPS